MYCVTNIILYGPCILVYYHLFFISFGTAGLGGLRVAERITDFFFFSSFVFLFFSSSVELRMKNVATLS